MLRPALHMPDALTPELLLEVRLPPPGRVLPALVRQHLLRRAVRRHPTRQRLQHQLAPLMVRQRMADHIARVVVHESAQVQPLLPPQQKREKVRLPQLIRCRPLEAARRVLPRWRRCCCFRNQPLFVQDPAHLALADAEGLEAPQHVSYPACAPVRMLLPGLDHRRTLHLRSSLLALRRLRELWRQRVKPALAVGLQPIPDRLRRRSENPCRFCDADPILGHLLHHPQPKCQRVCPASTRYPPRPTPPAARSCRTAAPGLRSTSWFDLSSFRHLRLSFPLTLSGGERRSLLQIYDSISPLIRWRAGHAAWAP